MFDILIKNGLLVNGKNEVPEIKDIGIVDDEIVEISDKLEESTNRLIDAQGKIVTPGFIDIHCHSDAIVFDDIKNPKRLLQGVTTEVVGNCGVSPAPINKKYLNLLKSYNEPFYASIPLPYDWETYGEYLDAIEENNPIVNIAGLVGHGALRVAIIGFEDRILTDKEIKDMQKLLDNSIKGGAFGMSSGLIYPPGVYADARELNSLGRTLKENEAIYTTHMRSESFQLVEAVEETIKLAKETGINAEISHHKAAGYMNFGKIKTTLKLINQAKNDGVNIDFDVYPYNAASTQFSAVLPPWALEGGVSELLKRLSNNKDRNEIISDIKNDSSYENLYQLAKWENILINECSVEKYVGKTVEQIAKELNKNPFETALDIILESKNNVMMIVFHMSEIDVKRAIKNENSIICSDGFPSFGKFHPRYIGSFIRVLEKYVKNECLISLPEAIFKMSGKPARKLGFTNRGILEAGYKADVLIMDFENLKDNSDYEKHDALSTGIEYVIINGQIGLDDGLPTNISVGKVLRKDVLES